MDAAYSFGAGTAVLFLIIFLIFIFILILLIVNAIYWGNVNTIIIAQNGANGTISNARTSGVNILVANGTGSTVTVRASTANSLYWANVIAAVILGIFLLLVLIYIGYLYSRGRVVYGTAVATTTVATPTASKTTTTTTEEVRAAPAPVTVKVAVSGF